MEEDGADATAAKPAAKNAAIIYPLKMGLVGVASTSSAEIAGRPDSDGEIIQTVFQNLSRCLDDAIKFSKQQMANDLLAAIDKLASQTAALSSQTAALSAQVAVIRNLITNTQSSPPPPIGNGLLNLAARGFATSGDPDAHRPHLEALKQQLESTWKSHAVAGANVVEVVAMSLGQWEPRPGCSSPRLWIFLGGHFRTFMSVSYTHLTLPTILLV